MEKHNCKQMAANSLLWQEYSSSKSTHKQSLCIGQSQLAPRGVKVLVSSCKLALNNDSAYHTQLSTACPH